MTDTPAAKKAPAKKADTAPAGSPSGRGPGRPNWREELRRQITEQLMALATSMAAIAALSGRRALAADAEAIMDRADAIAGSLVNLAEKNDQVKQWLTAGMQQSAWLGVLFTVGGLGWQIALNHMGDQADELPAPTDDDSPFAAMTEAARVAQSQGVAPPTPPASWQPQ